MSHLSRAIRWPLWSWRNLIVSLVLVLALLAALGRLTDQAGAVGAGRQASAAAPSQSVVSPSPSAPATFQVSPSTPSSTTSPETSRIGGPASPVFVASQFVAAWARSDRREQEWLAGMKPWATSQLVSSLTGTDPAQVPATKLTGEAALRASKGATATVVVPTDGGPVAIELTQASGRWRASALAPDDAPPAAATPDLESRTIGEGR